MRIFLILTTFLLALNAQAQSPILSPQEVANQFWQTLSGPAGTRNWSGIESLCMPDVRVNGIRYKEGRAIIKAGSLEDYRNNTAFFFKTNGFKQKITEENVFVYEHIATVLQQFETTITTENGSTITESGIATFQLIKLTSEWRIGAVSWNNISPNDATLPSVKPPIPDPILMIDTSKTSAAFVIEAPSARYETGVYGYVWNEAEVDSIPKFKGGDVAIFKWLGENMEIPSDPTEARMAGTFEVTFIVDTEGYVTNVVSKNAPGPGWYLQSVQALTSMPKWTPAQKGGKAVNCRVRLNIKFRGKG